jgi:hypothetical protein
MRTASWDSCTMLFVFVFPNINGTAWTNGPVAASEPTMLTSSALELSSENAFPGRTNQNLKSNTACLTIYSVFTICGFPFRCFSAEIR